MISSGSCSLIITGDKLTFNEITENLKIEPSRLFRKGDIVSKVIGPNQNDVWIYEMKFDESVGPNQSLESLLDRIKPVKDYLNYISIVHDVYIKYYLQSDLAQIKFEFLPNILKELAELNIKMEVSILSWGGVEDK